MDGKSRATGQLRRALDGRYEGQARLLDGRISQITQYDAAGRPQLATVQAGEATLINIPVAGKPGATLGATVRLRVRGSYAAPQVVDVQVMEYGAGAASTDPARPLSTPEVDRVWSSHFQVSGTTLAFVATMVRCIPEQYGDRQRIAYEVEIREAAGGTPVAALTSAPRELVLGQLTTQLPAGTIGGSFVLAAAAIVPAASLNFPDQYAILRIGAEEVLVRTAVHDAATGRVTCALAVGEGPRGYGGTLAATHSAGTWAVLVGFSIGIPGLRPNVAYEVRALAHAADGRASNPSDWVAHTTSYDVTPPTWAAGTITPAVAASPEAFVVEWPPADTNAGDLTHYDVQVGTSSNFAGATTYNAGSGPRFVLPALVGDERWFRVRAVDHTGNTSAWSASVRALALPPALAGNLLANPSFETNLAGWTTSLLAGSGSVVRVSSQSGAGSHSAEMGAGDGDVTAGTVALDLASYIAVTAGQRYLLRALLRADNGAKPNYMELCLRLFDSAGNELGCETVAATSGTYDRWIVASGEAAIPHGRITQAKIRIEISGVPLGTPYVRAWVDRVELVLLEAGDHALLSSYDLSSAPGAAARVLSSDPEGALTLERLTLSDRLRLQVRTSAPASPQNGEIYYSDGASWNPLGDGQPHIVARLAGGWVALG